MVDLERQNKLPDGVYVMSDIDDETADLLVELVDEYEYEHLFDKESVDDGWKRFTEAFYDDNKEMLCDMAFNYVIDGMPDDGIREVFTRTYRDNREYIISSFRYDEDFIAYFEADYLDLDLSNVDLGDFDPLMVRSWFIDMLLPVALYITEIMVDFSYDLESCCSVYAFTVEDGEIVDVEFNERFIDGEGMMDLSERSILEKLDEIKNPLDMNRRVRKICSTDVGREEALRMSYFFDCVDREVKVDILKYTFDFLCRLAPDETASYYISKARDHMFEIYQIE
ncbi:MAG: hypothetical protein NQU45_03650 [Methanothermobacter sp.]|jgi:hypothetical protein|nr:hypothetical protein [Methanothermobacter sp.]